MSFAAPESQRDSGPKPRVGELASLPWEMRLVFSQPQRGGVTPATKRRNPVGVENYFKLFTQGSRCAPTPGWMTLPRRGKAATADTKQFASDNLCPTALIKLRV